VGVDVDVVVIVLPGGGDENIEVALELVVIGVTASVVALKNSTAPCNIS
jgi:hypothetical protein